MRIAVISDIHGNLPALEAVLAAIAAEAPDLTINLGDALSGPLWPVETAERLMPLGLPTLAGNHERQLLTQALEWMGSSDAFAAARLLDVHRQWMQSLPATHWLAEDVFCCHGTPGSDIEYFLETTTADLGQHGSLGVRAAGLAEVAQRLGTIEASLVLCGHSHTARMVQVGPTLIVNPGSVGLPAFDLDFPHPHLIEAGSPHARWALLERHEQGWHADLRATVYDWQRSAAKAEQEGRPTWVHALRTGYALRA